MTIYEEPLRIKQFLMTSLPIENDNRSKKISVWFKILGWIFTWNNQICPLSIFGRAMELLDWGKLHYVFNFEVEKTTKTDSNWISKACSLLIWVHRIRWASQIFPTEKFGKSSKLKLKGTIGFFQTLLDWKFWKTIFLGQKIFVRWIQPDQ